MASPFYTPDRLTLTAGRTENDLMPLADSIASLRILDEVKEQVAR